MSRYSLDQARSDLGDLVRRAAAGETITIEQGADVVELRPTAPAILVPARPAPGQDVYDWLRTRREAMPPLEITSVELINEMYGEGPG